MSNIPTTDNLDALAWSASQLGEALAALARSGGLAPRAGAAPAVPSALDWDDDVAVGAWMDAAAAWLDIEVEPVGTSYADAERFVRGVGPALLRLPGHAAPRFLLLLMGMRRGAVLGPDLKIHQLSPKLIAAALRRPYEQTYGAEIDRMLAAAGIPARRRSRARSAILAERLGPAPIGGCWLLRLSPGANFWRQMQYAGMPRHLLAFVAAHTSYYLLWLLSWWVIGSGVLRGRLDWGWLLAWALLLLTLIPFRLLATWSQGRFAIGTGGLLKQRLLFGALKLEPEEIRHQGVGQLLGRVVESDAVESLALKGGFSALMATIELLIGALVLGVGAGGLFHTLLLVVWVGFTLLLVGKFYRRRRRWTAARLDMTHDLVEHMVGHRTTLAQQPRERRHAGDDRALGHYLDLSLPMDATTAQLIAIVPRGWLIAGLLILAPAFVAGGAPEALAVGLGGTLLAYQALNRLYFGVGYLGNALIAWRQAALLFHAAERPASAASPLIAHSSRLSHASTLNVAEPENKSSPARRNGSDAGDARPELPLLDARGLTFRYRDTGDPILKGCNLPIHSGDRLLLEGPSGGGKSTLAALLTGLRAPGSGLLLLDGFDQKTLGAGYWRRRVAAAPQFHENHVLTGTFAFNLLMGRRWPPAPADLEQAEQLCRELGLGELLARMPAGIQQMIGETGWQLSHGERSRLYLARALLQGADMIILDESFAALDPRTLQVSLQCVLRRAPTLLVIAHP